MKVHPLLNNACLAIIELERDVKGITNNGINSR